MIPEKNIIKNIDFYKDFILVSKSTLNALSYNYPKNLYFYCYLAENRIFSIFNSNIDVYILDKNGNIMPEIFYYFYSENDCKISLNNLQIQGYENYTKYHLIFIERNNQTDYASPIFDKNNKEIGYAYKYHPNLTDYTPYIVSKVFKSILKLYFYYLKLSKKIKSNKWKILFS